MADPGPGSGAWQHEHLIKGLPVFLELLQIQTRVEAGHSTSTAAWASLNPVSSRALEGLGAIDPQPLYRTVGWYAWPRLPFACASASASSHSLSFDSDPSCKAGFVILIGRFSIYNVARRLRGAR